MPLISIKSFFHSLTGVFEKNEVNLLLWSAMRSKLSQKDRSFLLKKLLEFDEAKRICYLDHSFRQSGGLAVLKKQIRAEC